MKKNWNERFNLSVVFLVVVTIGPLSTLAQDLTPIFPANGDVIPFSRLVDEGFQWTAPEGAVKFEIRMSGDDPVLSNILLTADSSPYKLDQVLKIYFKPSSNYSWWIVIKDGTGAGTVSEVISFAITDQNDLIPTPTPIGGPSTEPTPVPVVGPPRNLSFSPNDTPGFFANNFYILWDPPAYPNGAAFLYDILIQHEYADYKDEKRGLETTSLLYKTLTLEGVFKVYLRVRVEGVGTSEIITGQFQVRNQAALPTPTPVPLSPDISANQATNVLDVALFAKSFQRREGQVGFNPRADLSTDGIVDAKDLLLFFTLYRNRENGGNAPRWLSVEIPSLGADYQPDGGSPIVVELPPNEVHLGYSSNTFTCATSELYYGCSLHFSEVPGANQYYVTILSEKDADYKSTFYTAETSIHNDIENGVFVFNRYVPDDVLKVYVQTADENLQLGESSDVLRLIIPSQ